MYNNYLGERGNLIQHRILVINPGVHPEMQHLAIKLHSEDIAFRYVTCFGFGNDSSRAHDNSKFNLFGIRNSVKRRLLPLPDENIVRAYPIFDFILAVTSRWFPFSNRAMFTLRNRLIESKAVRVFNSGEFSLVVIQQTAGFRIMELAKQKGIPTVLNYSIAHHQWALEEARKEVQFNPRWAPFMQFPSSSRRERIRLNREIELASWILVGSEFVKRTFLSYGISSSKIQVVNLGVNLAELGVATKDIRLARMEKRLPSDPLNVIFVGQITQRKGLSYLLESFNEANLPKRSKLELIGNTPFPKIRRKLKHFPNVIHLGTLDKVQLGQKFCQANLYVLPSIVEGFALSAVEALATGIPVVVSTNTGVADIIQDRIDGFIVEPRNKAKLQQILEFASQNPELIEEIGERGRDKAQIFTWEKYEVSVFSFLMSIK